VEGTSQGRKSMRLIDTNILVYAFDKDSDKRERAQQVLSYYMGTGEAVICLQSIAEMYSALTKGMSPKEARLAAEEILESNSFKKIQTDPMALSEALGLAEKAGLRRSDVFDAVLASTAKVNGVETVLTENPKHFEGLGLKIETLETATLSENV